MHVKRKPRPSGLGSTRTNGGPDLADEEARLPWSDPVLVDVGPLEEDRGDSAARGLGRQHLDPPPHLPHPRARGPDQIMTLEPLWGSKKYDVWPSLPMYPAEVWRRYPPQGSCQTYLSLILPP